jgi:predicted phage tail component-like protein
MSAFINGTDFAEYGVRVLAGSQHDALPETRDRTITIPGMHGAYDYGADLGVRQFEIKCGLIDATDPADLQVKIRKLASELTDAYGRPKTVRLTFSEEPDKYYSVRYTGRVGVDRIHRLGFFSLPFTAFDPMARSVVTSDQIVMDSDTPIMSDLLWDTGLSERTITAPTTFTIANNGSTAIRFSFAVEGSGTNVTVAANGKTFTLDTFANKTIEVDGDSYIVKVNGVEDLTLADGDFIELMPGINTVAVGGSALNLTISESLTYKYV